MSASIATTGPRRVAYLANSDDRVVFPLPPLPTNATRMASPLL